MKMKIQKLFMFFFLWIFLVFPFLGNKVKSEVHSSEIIPESDSVFSSSESSKSGEEKISESWMGVYMGGIKVGYSHNEEFSLIKNGKKIKKSFSESWMKVTRLGGNSIEIATVQESIYDEQGKPLECIIRIKMSESETVMRAEIGPDKILFKSGDKIIKELPYEEEFYLEVPVEKIIEEEGLKPGNKYNFKILDFTSYSLVDFSFEVIGKEDVLILGKKMRLWHAKGETTYVIPLSIDEWIDESGNSWRSINKTSFTTLTSIRMPKEKALEVSEETFDIAFSTLIKPNVTFENPQKIQRVTFKLSGISADKIKNFPFDDGSQKIIEVGKDYVIVQTSSQIFKEEEAILFPVKDKEFRRFLKSSAFCQAEDPEIQKVAKEIV
ncbi:MAG: hypothetical protein KAW85_05060, partial [Candidatus Aminicenantes bacterium]|nr:hypothetical protein [Candidatus Aminicenantes bacterium]